MNYLSILNNEYTMSILAILAILYSGLTGPKLPEFIEKMFKNDIVRILVFAFIAYNGNKNPIMSLIISVMFLFIMNKISEKDIKEGFDVINYVNKRYE